MQQFRGGLVFEAQRPCLLLKTRLESNKEGEDPAGSRNRSDNSGLQEGRNSGQQILPKTRNSVTHGACGVQGERRFSAYSSQFENNYLTEMCSGSEAGSYLRLIDCVSLKSRLASNKEEEGGGGG